MGTESAIGITLNFPRAPRGSICHARSNSRISAADLAWMVNAVSAESLPRNRPEERARRKEILAALSGLIKEKRVFRWRRKNVAILDPGKEIIPF